jgi:hypothetical protein
MTSITVLDGPDAREIEGTIRDGRVLLGEAALEAALGFERKPEGLCRGEICIPIRDGSGLEADGRIDATTLADLLDRPVALDEAEGVASFGAAAADRHQALVGREAPDVELVDLDGNIHRLSGYRGKKVILVAYSSW